MYEETTGTSESASESDLFLHNMSPRSLPRSKRVWPWTLGTGFFAISTIILLFNPRVTVQHQTVQKDCPSLTNTDTTASETCPVWRRSELSEQIRLSITHMSKG